MPFSQKELLDYTEEELQNLSLEELKELRNVAAGMESLLDTAQLTEKTTINSLYGAIANQYFPLFNNKIAEAITGNGRYFIINLAKNVEECLQSMLPNDKPYVVYGDTDSIYFQIEPFVEKFKKKNPNSTIEQQVEFADKFENKVIQPVIKKTIEDFASELNARVPEKIGVEREVIADSMVFAAKKKYYARVRMNEGTVYPVDEPKYKVMGLEIIKSTTPKWSRKHLKEAIPHILDKDEKELREWVNEIKWSFIESDINDISNSGGVSSVDYKLGDKGLHIGARAALVHNNYIEKNNLEDQYSMISGGDKPKSVFLQMPNKFNSNVISYSDSNFVKEIDCVDWDMQYEKKFLNSLKLMVKSLGYNMDKKTGSFDDW